MIPTSDHLRGLLIQESPLEWWDRMLTQWCHAVTLGYGFYDKVLRDCVAAGFQ